MRIRNKQFLGIWRRYLARHQHIPDTDEVREQFKCALEFIEQRFGNELINCNALGSMNEATVKEHQLQWQQACQILEASLSATNNYLFDRVKAEGESLKIQQAIDYTSLLLIHGNTQNSGVREKFIKGSLTHSEWLTDLDLQRMLQLAQLNEQVHIVPFDVPSLGTLIHFEREKHQSSSNPYTIYLLLNKGNSIQQQGIHWFAGKITVYPDSNKIVYEITDSMKRSGVEQEYKKTMRSALTYHEQNQAGKTLFKAFDNWQIEGKVIGNGQQQDSFSCGYRAIHHLFQDTQLSGESRIASQYAVTPASSAELVKAFYRAQLEPLMIDDSLFIALSDKQQHRFSRSKTANKINKKELNLFLHPHAKTSTAQPVNHQVIHSVNVLDSFSTVQSFPGTADLQLTALDYENYFLELNQRLNKLETTLERLNLIPCDSKVLDGLNDYCELNAGIKINEINIDIAEQINVQVFIAKLKFSLTLLSQNHLNKLLFNDNHELFSESDWQEIADFIINNPITVSINLPPAYAKTALQQQIDDAVSVNSRMVNSQQLGKERKQNELLTSGSHTKRSRPKLSLRTVLITDIELQQEQQMELALANQTCRDAQQENAGVALIETLDLAGLKRKLLQDKRLFDPKSYLLTTEELEKSWFTWLGHIPLFKEQGKVYDFILYKEPVTHGLEVYPNEAVHKISMQACEQLLKHRLHFQYGINAKYLPQGFIILEDEESLGSFILHYEKTTIQQTNPVAPNLTHTLSKTIMAADVFNDIILSLDKDNPRDWLILEQWNQLNARPYSSSDHFNFRAVLPALLLLDEGLLEKLFSLCTISDELSLPLLTFALEHYQQIDHIYQGNFSLNRNTEIANNLLLHTYGPHTEDYIQCAHALMTSPLEQRVSSDSHILFHFLQDNPDLKQQMIHWTNSLSFTNKQLNALLMVYSKYSAEGLLKLISFWEGIENPDFLKQLHQTLFKNVSSFSFLIKDERYSTAFKTLNGLQQNPDKFVWWSKLFYQHSLVAEYDDLPSLVDSFIAFSQKIESYGLAFYSKSDPAKEDSAEIEFTDVRNLPTALGRILSILGACNAQEREEQWHCISRISLEPNGAIRAFTDQQGEMEQCGFVVPQMLATSIHYSDFGYNVEGWKYIGTLREVEQCQEAYYRFIAHQTSRLPLSFYQQMDEQIRAFKFPNKMQAPLYAILAKCTSGENYNSLSGNIADSVEEWTIILNKISNLSLPLLIMFWKKHAQQDCIESIFNLEHIPALPFVKKLVLLIVNAFNTMILDIVQLDKTLNTLKFTSKLLKRMRQLEELTRYYGDSIFKGMRFYGEMTNNQFHEPLLFRYVKAAMTLTQKQSTYQTMKRGDGKRLLALMSHFDLAIGLPNENIEISCRIRKAYDQAHATNPGVLAQAMDLLPYMDKRESPALNADHLESFLKEIALPQSNDSDEGNDTNKTVENLIKRHFAAYFPADFFEQLQGVGISKEVNALIEHTFEDHEEKQLVRKLLSHFNSTGDSLKFSEIIQHLMAITKPLSREERLVFFNRLISDSLIQGIKISRLNKLLLTIRQYDVVNAFLYFLNKADEMKAGENKDLLKKTVLFLGTILPSVSKLQSKTVTKMETLNLAIELLLATDQHKLNDTLAIKRPEQIYCEPLAIELQVPAEQMNLIKLPLLITFFLNNAPAENPFPALKKLQEHVQALTLPKTNGSKGLTSFLKKNLVFGKPVEKSNTINAQLLANAKQEFHKFLHKRNQFDQVLADLLQNINTLTDYYPGDKQTIIPYLSHFLSENYTDNTEQLVFSWNSINQLKTEFIAINDADIVRSLCNNFNNEQGEYTPATLLHLLSHETYQSLKENRIFFLRIVTVLTNNEKPCTLEELFDLMALCQRSPQGPQLLKALEVCYRTAPYPSLQQVNEWQQSCPAGTDLVSHLSLQYKAFDLAPCERDKNNGFDLEFAKTQAKQMAGLAKPYSESTLQNIAHEVSGVRSLTTATVQDELQALRKGELTIGNERLVALVAELLYRTKGRPAREENGVIKPSSSFEIHTTQYLAIHSMLEAGEHVTSEIGTGEGKSRIMMLMIACQYAKGKTVDFVTSDLQLATRDYLSYQSLFHALGAKTNLIYQNTPASSYRLDGINFSDTSNLALFRNKARSEGLNRFIIAPDANKRAIMVDEADRTYYDLAETRFNYSALGDEAIVDMPWIYELLIEFFSQDNKKIHDVYQNDIDACNKMLLEFAQTRLTPQQLKRLQSVSKQQLEEWQQSAITSLSLVFNRDFVIKPNVEIETAKGPRLVSEARLLIKNREDRSSRFSFGVHQCLAARLNWLKKHSAEKSIKSDANLLDALKGCRYDFFIDNEKQIIYSSTSKSMLDDYGQGTICAVTGTAGSIKEKEEAMMLYNSSASNMSFITVPRHKGLRRKDCPLYLAGNENTQRTAIVKYLRAALAAQQPVLVICESDVESQAMSDYLQKTLARDVKNNKIQLVRLSAQTSVQEENDHIHTKAGMPGMVTISTAMIGRGTDIPLHNEASQAGLTVLINYLPRERELQQIIGRSGRFGAVGNSRVILNKLALKIQLGKKSLKDGFYTASEAYIKQQQAIMDRKAQVERLIKFTVADFRQQLTTNYFEDFFEEVNEHERLELIRPWNKFFDAIDKKWNEIWVSIISEVDKVNPDIAVINNKLSVYQNLVALKWQDLKNEISLKPLKGKTDEDIHPAKKLLAEIPPIQISSKIEQLLLLFNAETIAPLKTTVFDRYDSAHDGKSALYTKPFETERAFLKGERSLFANFRAWLSGRGILFANTRAFLSGRMSLKQFLFGGKKTDLSVMKETVTEEQVLTEVHSTNKMMQQLVSEPPSSSPINATPEKPAIALPDTTMQSAASAVSNENYVSTSPSNKS